MIQYIPRVFKQFTDEDYLRGAVETANWLKTLEVKTEHGKSTALDSTHDENSRTMAFANTRYKLEVEKKLNIGFIGGSITANGGNKFYGFDERHIFL